MEEKKRINLQLFATQTTLLNTTGNDLSSENKTYYEKRLIDYAEPDLVHDQFGDNYDIPRNGGKSIEFRRFSSLAKALTPITEGVTPAGNKLDVTAITATVNQYGDFIELSDILDLTAIDPIVENTIKMLASQAGRTLDTITREVLVGGTNVMYAPIGDTPVTSRAEITGESALTVDVIYTAAAMLKSQNAPKIDGSYVGIVHPFVAADLMRSDGWLDVHKYARPENIYEGEIGKIGGVRFVETTEAKIWGNAGAGGASVFATLILGANAFGKTKLTGGGMTTIIKQLGSAGTSDPLDQRSTVGWKATKVAERLVEQYMIRIEHGSKTNTNAPSN